MSTPFPAYKALKQVTNVMGGMTWEVWRAILFDLFNFYIQLYLLQDSEHERHLSTSFNSAV